LRLGVDGARCRRDLGAQHLDRLGEGSRNHPHRSSGYEATAWRHLDGGQLGESKP